MSQVSTSAGDASWARHLIYMEAGADILSLGEKASSPKSIWSGVLLCAVLAAAAVAFSRLPFWPFTLQNGAHPLDAAMLAVILGMLLANLWTLPSALHSGIQYAVKKILPLGIVLLGARLNLRELANLGMAGVLLSMLQVAVALGLALWLGKKFGLSRRFSTLLGVGTAICGGSAIVATAPVIRARDEEVVVSVATVVFAGLLAMFALPLIGHALGLSERLFGLWAGLSIHNTPQVVAAGFAYGSEAGATATVVKLVRVCLLAPVIFGLGFVSAKLAGGAAKPRAGYLSLFPAFVLGLLAVVVFRSLGLLPDFELHFDDVLLWGSFQTKVSTTGVASEASQLCIAVAMAAMGLETRAAVLRKTGLAPLSLTLLVTTLCALGTLALLFLAFSSSL